MIEVELWEPGSPDLLTRLLLADTGAGDSQSSFELILHEDDCRRCSTTPLSTAVLGGTYSGVYSIYILRVKIQSLGFDDFVPVVGLPDFDEDFDGIACFRFLNRFTYGNFGDANGFGLEL